MPSGSDALVTSNSPVKNKHDDNEQDQAQTSDREIAPILAVGPSRENAEDGE